MSRLTDAEVAIIKGMLARGDEQHHIAAFFGENSGRIAEINTGQRFRWIAPADAGDLPPCGPYRTPYALWQLRVALEEAEELARQALMIVRKLEQAERR